MQPHTVHTPIEWLDHRLSVILLALQPLIAQHFLRHPSVPHAVTIPLWRRFGRTAGRLARLIALYAAGRLPRPRVRAASPAAPRVRKPLPPMPRRHGWMLAALGWRVACYRNQLIALLDMPQTAQFLAAAPAAGRLLRPLCHMLGVRHASLGVRHASLGVSRAPGRSSPARAVAPCPQPRAIPALPAPEAAPQPAASPECPRLRARWPWARPAAPSVTPQAAPLRRLAAPLLPFPLAT